MFIFCVYPYFAFHWTPWTRKQCIHIRQRVRMCSISPVWVLHCTVADTEQVVLPHIYSSWSLLQADYSKISFCWNIMSISVSPGEKCIQGITLFLKQTWHSFFERKTDQFGREGSTMFIIEIVPMCKACY